MKSTEDLGKKACTGRWRPWGLSDGTVPDSSMANSHAFSHLSACSWAWTPTMKQTRKVLRSPMVTWLQLNPSEKFIKIPCFGSIQVIVLCLLRKFWVRASHRKAGQIVYSFGQKSREFPQTSCSVSAMQCCVFNDLKIKRVYLANAPSANSRILPFWHFTMLGVLCVSFVRQDTVMNWHAVYFCSAEPSSLQTLNQLQRLSVHWPRRGSFLMARGSPVSLWEFHGANPTKPLCHTVVYLFQCLQVL